MLPQYDILEKLVTFIVVLNKHIFNLDYDKNKIMENIMKVFLRNN